MSMPRLTPCPNCGAPPTLGPGALLDPRSPAAATWKYLDDGVTLMRAALQAIPECYGDGEPNQLYYAIDEWLKRPERASQSDATGDGKP